jgi:3-hydroxyacyl-[acyl-carrier-protein] dehydratase
MRWFWVDRFTEFVSGKECSAIKCVSLVEEAVDEYIPGYPVLPCSVMIEGLAQCGGILVAETFDFDKRVVLAKVNSASFQSPAVPGDRLRYHVVLDSVQEEGAVVDCTVHREDELVATAQLMFAFLDDSRFGTTTLFAPEDLRGMLLAMKLYDVAVDAQGKPLSVSRRLYSANAS